jgi:hypothetical protein
MDNDDELVKKRKQLSTAKEFAELREYRQPPKPSKTLLKERRKKQRKIGLGSDSGKYAAHVYQVFNDPDFDVDIKKLQEQFNKMYYPDVSLTTDYLDKHLLVEDKALIKSVADKYCITLDDLGIYADGSYEAGIPFGRRVYEYGGFIAGGSQYHDNMQYFYALGPKTSLQQIAQDWDRIQEIMIATYTSVKTKSKSPENPALIYAMFKARATGLTFTKIFRQYQDGELAGYKGSTSQYSSKDSLERYYRKYMPTPQDEEVRDYENPSHW